MFCSMTAFHQAYSTLKAPTVRRVYKMGSYAILISYTLSLVFVMFVYFSLGQLNQNFPTYLERPKISPDSRDIPMVILKIGKYIAITG